jgi:hypothetical protein
MTSGAGFSWEAPTEHGRHWIEVELDYPVPWEHEGAGSITWGREPRPVGTARGGGREHHQ